MLWRSANSRSEPSLIAALVAAMDRSHASIWTPILADSDKVSSGYLGPSSVSITPSEAALRERARSNRSTPIHDSKAQLSGPPIPGVQSNEFGKLVLKVYNAVISAPGRWESCIESTRQTTEGSSFVSFSISSWCIDCQDTASNWSPLLNSPESDSERLGGSTRPSVEIQESSASNGTHRFPLVAKVTEAGRFSESLVDMKGESARGNSESFESVTSPGVQDEGWFRSPSCITRARRCLATVARANGRSVIRVALTRFA